MMDYDFWAPLLVDYTESLVAGPGGWLIPQSVPEPVSTDVLRELCQDAGTDGTATFTSEGGYRMNP